MVNLRLRVETLVARYANRNPEPLNYFFSTVWYFIAKTIHGFQQPIIRTETWKNVWKNTNCSKPFSWRSWGFLCASRYGWHKRLSRLVPLLAISNNTPIYKLVTQLRCIFSSFCFNCIVTFPTNFVAEKLFLSFLTQRSRNVVTIRVAVMPSVDTRLRHHSAMLKIWSVIVVQVSTSPYCAMGIRKAAHRNCFCVRFRQRGIHKLLWHTLIILVNTRNLPAWSRNQWVFLLDRQLENHLSPKNNEPS